jgi:hypothetical protein
MEIAPEHAEAEGERAGADVKERFLLDRIALDSADVTPGYAKVSAAIHAHFAYAYGTIRDRALVPARITANSVPGDRFDELWCCLCGSDLEHFGKRGHW